MKKRYSLLFKTILLVGVTAALVSFSDAKHIHTKAAEVIVYKADFADAAARTGTMSSYTAQQTIKMKYEDTTIEWIAFAGNAYNLAGEGGTRFGGKNTAPKNSEITNRPAGIDADLHQLWLKTSEVIPEAITKVEVVTKASFGTASHTSGGTRKTFLQVSANADFSASQEYVLGTELNHTHIFTPTSAWAENMYYRILWEKSASSANTGIIINAVNFYIEVESETLPTGVTLNTNSVSVEEEETVQLFATVLPPDANDKSVTWSSANNNVATVDQDGVITGVSPGTTTITVVPQKGTGSASATVTVTAGPLYKDSTLNFEGWGGSYDPYSLTSKGLDWEVNVGTLSQSVTYFGSNSTASNIAKMNTEGKFSVFADFPDEEYKNIAVMFVENKAVQGLTHFGVNWTTMTGSGLIGLTFSQDGGNTFTKIGTEATITADGSAVWNGSGQADTLVGVYLLSKNYVNIRNMSFRIEGTKFVEPQVQPSSVAISGPTSVYTGHTIELTAVVSPGAASQDVTWESLHTSIATVTQGGVVTGISAGSATIKVTTTNGKTTTHVVNVMFAPTYSFTLGGKTEFKDHLLGDDSSLGKISWEFAAAGDGELYAGGSVVNGAQFGKTGVPLDALYVTSEIIALDDYIIVESFNVEVRGLNTFMDVHFIDYVGNKTAVAENIALTNELVVHDFDLSAVDMPHHIGRIQLSFTGMSQAMYIKSLEMWLSEGGDLDLSSAFAFANKLEKYKTCTEYTDAVANLSGDYNALSAQARAYLEQIKLRDFASQSYETEFGRDAYVSAIHKWMYTNYTEDNKVEEGPSGDLTKSTEQNSAVNATLVISLLGITTLAGYYFLTRKEKKLQK